MRHSREHHAPAGQAEMGEGQRRVILVEDDAGMRRALTRLLAAEGHAVTSFDSAEALLETLDESPDRDLGHCLVCDVRLPGISGLELHRRLCEQGSVPACIFITAYDSPAVRAKAEHSACAFLLKPFEGRALLALIARIDHQA